MLRKHSVPCSQCHEALAHVCPVVTRGCSALREHMKKLAEEAVPAPWLSFPVVYVLSLRWGLREEACGIDTSQWPRAGGLGGCKAPETLTGAPSPTWVPLSGLAW